MSSTKEMIIDELNKVKRKGVKDLIKYLENSDFFTAPASTKYHGAFEGGLAEHSINVLTCLRFLYDNLKDAEYNLPQISDESIMIAALGHDICKVNTYFESPRWTKDNSKPNAQWEQVMDYKKDPLLPMGHGGKSVFIIQQFMQLTVEEASAIFWHMGAYDTSGYMTLNELGSAYENNLLAFLLNQADMYATYIIENKIYATTDGEITEELPFN